MNSGTTAMRWVVTSAAFAAMLGLGAAGAAANAKPAAEAECQSSPAVVINGGTMVNTTDISLSANGGTGIADASGGDNNFADPGNGGFAGAGNGGAANAGANGGAAGMNDVFSGNNAGSAIGVGNTIDGNLCDGVPAVAISGGEVINQTTIDVSANGGTAIADASGGDNNVAMGGGSAGAGGGGVASAGNGGAANAGANGGAVSIGDVNSGSNTGNIVTVGNTIAGPAPKPEPKPKPKPVCCEPEKPGGKVVPGKAPKVRALPSTGAGLVDPGLLAALAAAGSVGAAGAAGLGLRRR
ncbi:MAG: hypothetical protein ACKOWF_13355 [Chloroflexota bacterium]